MEKETEDGSEGSTAISKDVVHWGKCPAPTRLDVLVLFYSALRMNPETDCLSIGKNASVHTRDVSAEPGTCTWTSLAQYGKRQCRRSSTV